MKRWRSASEILTALDKPRGCLRMGNPYVVSNTCGPAPSGDCLRAWRRRCTRPSSGCVPVLPQRTPGRRGGAVQPGMDVCAWPRRRARRRDGGLLLSGGGRSGTRSRRQHVAGRWRSYFRGTRMHAPDAPVAEPPYAQQQNRQRATTVAATQCPSKTIKSIAASAYLESAASRFLLRISCQSWKSMPSASEGFDLSAQS